MPMTDGTLTNDKLTVLLFGIGIAAVVVTLYHCMAACWCNRQRSRNAAAAAQPPVTEVLEFPSSLETSVAQLIPAHKYQKDSSLVVGDGTCAVCLSEFEDGEELRTMPECLHSFHAPCIDMWLYSHPNCPMCRTGATPSPQPFGRSPEDSGPGAGETVDSGVFRNYGMLQSMLNN